MKTKAEQEFYAAVFEYKKKKAKRRGAMSPSYAAALDADKKRLLLVSGNPAYWGKINTAVFELEGSPPRHPVVLSGMQVGLYEIIIDWEPVRTTDVDVTSSLINPALEILKERGLPI